MMKTLKLIMSVVAIAAAVIFTGCTKDKDQGDPFNDVKVGWSESGNTMKYKVVTTGTKADTFDLYYLFTLKFDGETCISAVWELGCPNASLAAEVMAGVKEEMKGDPDMEEVLKMFSTSGRIIKVDLTLIFKEIPKTYIKMAVEAIGNQY